MNLAEICKKDVVKLSYVQRYSTSKLAQVTVRTKESTQLDVYFIRKMARNHDIMNLTLTIGYLKFFLITVYQRKTSGF